MANTLDGVLTFSGGGNSSLGVTTSTVLKATSGRLIRATVQVAVATAAITLNDANATGNASASNAFHTIPIGAAVGTIYYLDWPCASGIVVSYGASATGTLAFSWW